MLDSHIHLDADQYADVAGLIKRARDAGVTAVVVPGISPASNQRAMKLTEDFPDFVYAALGFHPERFELDDHDLAETLRMIREHRDRICAIGEVGLPWYGEAARRGGVVTYARKVLARFAALASESDLPLIVHSPHQTAPEALEIIKAATVRRAVFHWHKSDDSTTRAIIEAGYFISLTPEVVYRERDQALARIVPLSQMMVETDGPWSHGGPFEGRPTEPSFIADVISAIARVRDASVDAIRSALTANEETLFGITA